MRILQKTYDGGPASPVDAFFLFEIKSIASIALLRFNRGGREAFHTHAFNALTWFICGDLVEEDVSGETYSYRRSIIPKFTPKKKNHRVKARQTSWCFTLRGPWADTWTETHDEVTTRLTHGRRRVD